MSEEELASALRGFLWTPGMPSVTEAPRELHRMGREVYAWYSSAPRPGVPASVRRRVVQRMVEEIVDGTLYDVLVTEVERIARGAWPGARFWSTPPETAWSPETAMAWSVARWPSFEEGDLAVPLPVARARLAWCAVIETALVGAIPFARRHLRKAAHWRELIDEMREPGPRRQDWRPG